MTYWQTIRWRDWVFTRLALKQAGQPMMSIRTLIRRRRARKIGRGLYQLKYKL